MVGGTCGNWLRWSAGRSVPGAGGGSVREMPPRVSPTSEGVREETDATVIPLITEWLSGGGGRRG